MMDHPVKASTAPQLNPATAAADGDELKVSEQQGEEKIESGKGTLACIGREPRIVGGV